LYDAVQVWVELAEDGFVDEDENLMAGETCLRAVKAYASSIHESETQKRRFLCAGALVQRPNSRICDAWMADCLMDETNVQLQGALLILDDLFEFHLRNNRESNQQQQYDLRNNRISSFVVQSGSSLDSEYHCASYMAATLRGFRPLKELSREGRLDKKYASKDFLVEEEDPDAMIFDPCHGLEVYMSENVQSSSPKAKSIAKILLSEDEVIR
jgi:hypothetical protein